VVGWRRGVIMLWAAWGWGAGVREDCNSLPHRQDAFRS
jgi:hypothetical protein